MSVQEQAVLFGADRGLVGILSRPAAPRAGTPHVIVLSTGILHRVGSNRISVDLARALAADGVPVFRFDLSGVGDSTRRRDVSSVRQSVERDIAEAIDYLVTAHGADRVVLVGICSGAFDALSASLSQQRVVGALVVDLPGPFKGWRHTLHHLWGRLRRGAFSLRNPMRKVVGHSRALVKRASGNLYRGGYVVGGRGAASREHMKQQLDVLLARSVRLHFMFTAGLENNYNHRSQFRTTFPEAARHPSLSWDFYPVRDHAFSSRSARERLVGFTVDWLKKPWPNGQNGGRTG